MDLEHWPKQCRLTILLAPFFELSGRNHGRLATLAWKFSSSSSIKWPFFSMVAEGWGVSAGPLSSPSPRMIRSMSARCCSSCCCCLLPFAWMNECPVRIHQPDPFLYTGLSEFGIRNHFWMPFVSGTFWNRFGSADPYHWNYGPGSGSLSQCLSRWQQKVSFVLTSFFPFLKFFINKGFGALMPPFFIFIFLLQYIHPHNHSLITFAETIFLLLTVYIHISLQR